MRRLPGACEPDGNGRGAKSSFPWADGDGVGNGARGLNIGWFDGNDGKDVLINYEIQPLWTRPRYEEPR